MNLVKVTTPNKWVGGNRMEIIVIHWWDDPARKPTLNGVVSWMTNPESEVAAHYIVSGDDTVQLAEETDRPWHALQANHFGIGIEVNPQTPGNTYKTLGELVRAIRKRRGNLPLKRHSDYVNTTCPGNIDLARIDREAKEGGSMEEFKVLLRILNSEAKGWDRAKVHRGDYDKREVEYAEKIGISAYAQQAWNEGAGHRGNQAKWKAAFDTQATILKEVENLKKKTTDAIKQSQGMGEQLQAKGLELASANDALDELREENINLQKELADRDKQDAGSDSITINKDGLWNWFKGLFKK